jgi:hypothetical protein
MNEFKLFKIQESKDSLTGKLTFTQTSEINIVQSIRWFSSYVILQLVVKQEECESSFGLIINNRKKEKQY